MHYALVGGYGYCCPDRSPSSASGCGWIPAHTRRNDRPRKRQAHVKNHHDRKDTLVHVLRSDSDGGHSAESGRNECLRGSLPCTLNSWDRWIFNKERKHRWIQVSRGGLDYHNIHVPCGNQLFTLLQPYQAGLQDSKGQLGA